MTSDQNSALANLEYIKQIMTDTRNAIHDKGIAAIVWGVMVALGQIGNYVLVETRIDGFLWLWASVIGLGWFATYIDAKKSYSSKIACSFAEKILNAIWISAGITMTIVGFCGPVSGLVSGYAINPLIATIMGGTYFAAGTLYGKKWFQRLSFGWWGGAIVMFYLQNKFTFLIFAVMFLLFQAVPGIIFYKSYKASRGV